MAWAPPVLAPLAPPVLVGEHTSYETLSHFMKFHKLALNRNTDCSETKFPSTTTQKGGENAFILLVCAYSRLTVALRPKLHQMPGLPHYYCQCCTRYNNDFPAQVNHSNMVAWVYIWLVVCHLSLNCSYISGLCRHSLLSRRFLLVAACNKARHLAHRG